MGPSDRIVSRFDVSAVYDHDVCIHFKLLVGNWIAAYHGDPSRFTGAFPFRSSLCPLLPTQKVVVLSDLSFLP